MTYNELKNEENKYVMNTYGRFPIALDHGKGATLWDVEGKKYIDLASGIGVNCMGYDNQILIDAITRQAHTPPTCLPRNRWCRSRRSSSKRPI